jgi:hypothetical protein
MWVLLGFRFNFGGEPAVSSVRLPFSMVFRFGDDVEPSPVFPFAMVMAF